jgi:hypothetical protein
MARLGPGRGETTLTTLFAFALVCVSLAVIWIGG